MKRRFQKCFTLLLMVFALAMVAPSVLPSGMQTVEAASVKISKTKLTLSKGASKTLKITGTSSKVTWSSSKKSVATVSSNGKVKAKKKGTATITAKVNGKTYKCKVKVEAPKISKTSVTITEGDKTTLKMSGTTQTVSWSSNKTSVATVSSEGLITGKSAGTATITAKVGGKKYTCKVTVKAEAILSVSQKNITINETGEILVELDAAGTVTYSIEDTSIISCEWGSPSGNEIPLTITGKKIGNTTVTISNSKNSETCTINVIVSAIPVIKTEQYIMAGYAINCAYLSAKYPSTLHIYGMTYEDNIVNDMGDTISRLVLRCYAQNGFGGYGTYYIVVLSVPQFTGYSGYTRSMTYDDYCFISYNYDDNPGMSGTKLDNATALKAYQSLYNTTREIPYD